MRCHKVQQRLSAFLDGERDDKELAPLKRHLDSCARCREAYRDFQAHKEGFKSWPTLAPPLFFPDRVLARLAEKDEQTRRRLWVRSWTWPRPALATGVLGLGLFLGVSLGMGLHKSMDTAKATSAAVVTPVQEWDYYDSSANASFLSLGEDLSDEGGAG